MHLFHPPSQDGGRHERTNSVVISEQETKMEGVQHVYNKKDNIDAALVCEDRLRERRGDLLRSVPFCTV